MTCSYPAETRRSLSRQRDQPTAPQKKDLQAEGEDGDALLRQQGPHLIMKPAVTRPWPVHRRCTHSTSQDGLGRRASRGASGVWQSHPPMEAKVAEATSRHLQQHISQVIRPHRPSEVLGWWHFAVGACLCLSPGAAEGVTRQHPSKAPTGGNK